MSEEVKETVVEQSQDVMASTVHASTDPVVSAKTLLDSGCHFGHRVSRWNPKLSLIHISEPTRPAA